MKIPVFLTLTILAIGDFNVSASFFKHVRKSLTQIEFEAKKDCRKYLTTGSYKVYNHEKTLQEGLTFDLEARQSTDHNGWTKIYRHFKIHKKKLFLEALDYNYDPARLTDFKVFSAFKIKSCEKDPDSDMIGVDYKNTIDDQTIQTIYFEKK